MPGPPAVLWRTSKSIGAGRSVMSPPPSASSPEPSTWIEAYLRDQDPTSLADTGRSGRPSFWSEGLERRLPAAMALSRQQLDYSSVEWPAPLLREYPGDQDGVSPFDDTIRRGLRLLGYVWKRPQYLLEPGAELEQSTTDPPQDPTAAAPDRPPPRGRDRPVGLSAVAGRLGAEG